MAGGWGERGSVNEGIIQTGGTINTKNLAVGKGASVSASPSSAPAVPKRSGPAAHRDVGVITVLGVELRAVVEVFKDLDDYKLRVHPEGPRFHEAVAATESGPLTLVATQTADQGQRSVILAYEALQRSYDPVFVLLVGIAGGVHPDVQIGDVVVSSEAVFYDARKETPEAMLRRGRSFPVSTVLQHAVNAFESELDQPVAARDGDGFRVYVGPVGTGEAVIANADSDIRTYLRQYNDKLLAVETEAGGLAQAYHETAAGAPPRRGWLTVRGISDLADAAKGDRDHARASRNAATVLRELLPYLSPIARS